MTKTQWISALAVAALAFAPAFAFAQEEQTGAAAPPTGQQETAPTETPAPAEAAEPPAAEALPPAEPESPAEPAVEIAAPPALQQDAQAPAATPGEAAAINPNYRSPMPPPGPLFRVDGHWSPYFTPDVPEGASVHVIQPGDTLWDLAAKHAGDSYLWPEIWQHNLYITDPHWIYPGDPLFLKPFIVLTPEVVAEAKDAARDTELEETEEETAAVPSEEPRVAETAAPGKKDDTPKIVFEQKTGPGPAATFDEMYCSYFVNPGKKPSYDLEVVSLQNIEAEIGGEGDIVFLNRGYEHGLAAGQEFAAFRPVEKVRHPKARRTLGTAVYRVGKVRVLSVQPKTAMGVVAQSCREIRPGDGLTPWQEIPIPLYVEGAFDKAVYAPSGKPSGYIVHAKDQIELVGERHIVTVDLGEGHGVAPGDFITVYQDNPAGPDFQRYLVAEMIVLLAQESTATCKVMRAITEASIGSAVEVK